MAATFLREFKTAGGIGVHPSRFCWGCNTPKAQAGSKGVGVRWRCAACVTAKAAQSCGDIQARLPSLPATASSPPHSQPTPDLTGT